MHELYSIEQIAEGLELDVATVCAVIESRSLVRFPRALLQRNRQTPAAHLMTMLPTPSPVDEDRLNEARYSAWAKARTGAAEALRAA